MLPLVINQVQDGASIACHPTLGTPHCPQTLWCRLSIRETGQQVLYGGKPHTVPLRQVLPPGVAGTVVVLGSAVGAGDPLASRFGALHALPS